MNARIDQVPTAVVTSDAAPADSEALRHSVADRAEAVASGFHSDLSELPTHEGLEVREIHPENVSLREFEKEMPIGTVLLDYLNAITPASLASMVGKGEFFRDYLVIQKQAPIPGPIDYFCIRSLFGGSGNDADGVATWEHLPNALRNECRAEFKRKYLSHYGAWELRLLDSVANDARLMNGLLAEIHIPDDPAEPLDFDLRAFENTLRIIANRIVANVRSLSNR